MSFLNNLQWRFAVKQFNPNKKISDENLNKILNAIRFTPTSMGLQPFHVFVINNKKLQQTIKTKSYNQPQVTDAGHLLIFCARTDMKDRVNEYLKLAGNGNAKQGKLQPLKSMLENSTQNMSADDLLNWAKCQTYIALGFGLAACAELKIDSCPMEGFSTEEIDEILKLPKHLKSVAYLAIGYRMQEPKREKIRFSKNELFTNLT